MSANTQPTPSEPATTDPVVDQPLALARNASRNIDEHDPIDHWYRLGQRNAYAHATGQLLAADLGRNPFGVAERITTALDAGVSDLDELHAAAHDHGVPSHTPTPAIEWVGPRAFDSAHRNVRGIDRDYGMRWGQRGNQRISLRLNGDTAPQRDQPAAQRRGARQGGPPHRRA